MNRRVKWKEWPRATDAGDGDIRVAYVWRSGLVEASLFVPPGCLSLGLRGPSNILNAFLQGCCRHAYPPSEDLLLPGVPEANSEEDALLAVHRFMEWISKSAIAHGLRAETKPRVKK